jgi:hypothetical protein
LPNPRQTDVPDHNNLCYVHDPVTTQAPTHIPDNVAVGGGTNVVPPAHTRHFSNTFAGSSSSSHTIGNKIKIKIK